jgi:hypothetical protein
VAVISGGRWSYRLPVVSKRDIKALAGWLILAVAVAAVFYVLIWYGPDVLARHDVGNVSGPERSLRLQEARDAGRGRLLTLGAGVFAAAALIFTARNYLLAREQLEVIRQGQVADRYTKAIGQLGSEKLDVRIGGIYALEMVALDSTRDHPTVMEVLAVFVREHSREQWPAAGSAYASAPGRRPRSDVQAALTVLGRRDAMCDRQPINLSSANLAGADLADADLAGADLTDTDLTGADLTGANLTSTDLTSARWPIGAAVPEGWELDVGSGLLNRVLPVRDETAN